MDAREASFLLEILVLQIQTETWAAAKDIARRWNSTWRNEKTSRACLRAELSNEGIDTKTGVSQRGQRWVTGEPHSQRSWDKSSGLRCHSKPHAMPRNALLERSMLTEPLTVVSLPTPSDACTPRQI